MVDEPKSITFSAQLGRGIPVMTAVNKLRDLPSSKPMLVKVRERIPSPPSRMTLANVGTIEAIGKLNRTRGGRGHCKQWRLCRHGIPRKVNMEQSRAGKVKTGSPRTAVAADKAHRERTARRRCESVSERMNLSQGHQVGVLEKGMPTPPSDYKTHDLIFVFNLHTRPWSETLGRTRVRLSTSTFIDGTVRGPSRWFDCFVNLDANESELSGALRRPVESIWGRSSSSGGSTIPPCLWSGVCEQPIKFTSNRGCPV
ncbi:hypothetical protein J6590_041812 [Homalodisca vitripennis]|nr:hypothetical protein J6590_041812 [Homalodisca vitripennis]